MTTIATNRRDPWGSLLGILTFLAGVAMITGTFFIAWGLFNTPAAAAMNPKPGEPMDFGPVVARLVEIGVKVILLFVMCVVGSVLAKGGIRMYASATHPVHPVVEEPKKADNKPDEL